MEIPFFREVAEPLKKEYSSIDERRLLHEILRRMIHALISDLCHFTKANLCSYKPSTFPLPYDLKSMLYQ